MKLAGKLHDSQLVLTDGGALPNATAGYLPTTAIEIPQTANGKARIFIVAETDVTITATKILMIQIACGSTTTPTAVLASPVFYCVGATGNTVYKAGSVIAELPLPKEITITNKYIRLKCTTDYDASAMTINAFVGAKL